MNPWLLASRFIARRRSILHTGMPLGISALLVVLATAVLTGVTLRQRELNRRTVGELRSVEAVTEATEFPAAAGEPGLVESRALVAPAMVVGEQGGPVVVWFADIDRESAFRGVPAPEMQKLTVVLPGSDTFEADAYLFDGRGYRELVIDPESVSAGMLETTPGITALRRVRGEQPLETSRIESLMAAGFERTGWHEVGTEIRDVRRVVVTIVFIIVAAGALTTGGGVHLVRLRYRSDFALLESLGHSRAYRNALLGSIGAITGGVAGAAGALMAGVVVSLVNLRGGLDLTRFLSVFPVPASGQPLSLQISVAAMIACAAGSAVVGALSALPSIGFAGRIASHRSPWR